MQMRYGWFWTDERLVARISGNGARGIVHARVFHHRIFHSGWKTNRLYRRERICPMDRRVNGYDPLSKPRPGGVGRIKAWQLVYIGYRRRYESLGFDRNARPQSRCEEIAGDRI